MIIIRLSDRVKKIFNYFQLFFSILLVIIIHQHSPNDPSFSVAKNKENYWLINLFLYKISDFFVISLGNIALAFPLIFLANAFLKITHRKALELILLLAMILIGSSIFAIKGENFNGGIIGLSLFLSAQKITKSPTFFLTFVLTILAIIFIICEILKRNKRIDKTIINIIRQLKKNIQSKIFSFSNKVISIKKNFRQDKKLESGNYNLNKKDNFESFNDEKVYFYNQDYDKKNEFFIQEKNGFRLYKRIRNKIEDKKDDGPIMPKRIFENEQNQKLYEEIFERKKNNFDNSIIRDNFRPKKKITTNTNFKNDKLSSTEELYDKKYVEQDFENEELVDYHERDDLLSGLRNNFEKIQFNTSNNHIAQQNSHIERVMFKKNEEDVSVVENVIEIPQIHKSIEIIEKKEEIREEEIIQPVTTQSIPTPLRSDIQRNDFQKLNLQSKISPLSFIGPKQQFKLPDINFLSSFSGKKVIVNHQQAQNNADRLIKVLKDFSVYGKIINYHIGPVITLYEFEPLPGTKSSRVIGLCDDIARSLSAISARISVIPGKNALGIELPNENREIVVLKDIFDSEAYKNHEYQLPIALGKNIAGEPIVVDLVKMPHLLVAGTTGSGKSVAINVMILSILYALTPEECKFIMIDPKMLELSIYNGIPHLLTPVVTDPKKSIVVLKWVVREMEERYRLMSYLGVRNIKNFNEKIDEAIRDDIDLVKTINLGFDRSNNEPIKENIFIEKKKYPYIVVIVDEMADLMLVAGKEVEFYIQRLAQMARAAGIHIIMATQRPSVDVITGVIKANLPTRISFAVTSKIDSRTILGEQGAEQLLGMGDMLYMASGNKIVRVHGPFVSDLEVSHVVNYLQSFGPPDYLESITNQISSEDDPVSSNSSTDSESDFDEDYQRALNLILKEKKVSISYIQRQLRIGYNKSATIVEKMEKDGVVTSPNHQGKRELITS